MKWTHRIAALLIAVVLPAAALAQPGKKPSRLPGKKPAGTKVTDADKKMFQGSLKLLLAQMTTLMKMDREGARTDEQTWERWESWGSAFYYAWSDYLNAVRTKAKGKLGPNGQWMFKQLLAVNILFNDTLPMEIKMALNDSNYRMRNECRVYPAKLKRARKDMVWADKILRGAKQADNPGTSLTTLKVKRSLVNLAGYRIRAVASYVKRTKKSTDKFFNDKTNTPDAWVRDAQNALKSVSSPLAKLGPLDPAFLEARTAWDAALTEACEDFEDGYEALAKRYEKLRKGTLYWDLEMFKNIPPSEMVKVAGKIHQSLARRIERTEAAEDGGG